MKFLILGGAGYIGSHMVRLITERGHESVTFDNLSTGHANAVTAGELVVGDILDANALDELFTNHGPFDAVMHFCAKSLVGESVEEPAIYYQNNIIGTITLLDAMRRHRHDRLVFSSTAAVYGVPDRIPIDETHRCEPINPYGVSKLTVERMLRDYARAYGFRSVSFRYFNAAGAASDASIGERHDPETHLIPNVLKSLLSDGERLKVFGDEYFTHDGSCVRDYVHVDDLCEAHLAAVSYMDAPGAHVMNLGNGTGFSVFEVIAAAEKVTNCRIEYDVVASRKGDPPTLVADATKANRELNWEPKHVSIETIVSSAWEFHRR